MSLVRYPALGTLALDDAFILTAAGTDLNLLLADVALNLPNMSLSSRLESQIRSTEPLPVMSAEVAGIDADNAAARCAQLFSEWLSAHSNLMGRAHGSTVILCPETARWGLELSLPAGFGSIYWVHDLPAALVTLNDLSQELDQPLLLLTMDSLIDPRANRQRNGDLATEANPEGCIPAEAVCGLSFQPTADSGPGAATAVEPFTTGAATELTTAIRTLLKERTPCLRISNRSTNNADGIAEWYREFGSSGSDFSDLSTRQSLGDTGLADVGLVLALALAKARYEQTDMADCLIFREQLRLHWQPQRTEVNQHQGTLHE